MRRDDIKIDPASLRNLDLLSGLQHMDKRFLNRAKLLGKWVQQNKCNLPLRQILETYPRCYCYFNPCSHQQPADAAARINGTIQDGIECFRTHLHRCGPMIMVEVRTLQVNDSTLRPITALLSDGPMIPLKLQTIRLLNRIIGKYPNEFLAEFRKKQAIRKLPGLKVRQKMADVNTCVELMDHPEILERIKFPRRSHAPDTPDAFSHFVRVAETVLVGCGFYRESRKFPRTRASIFVVAKQCSAS
jgi:hypothetical protein